MEYKWKINEYVITSHVCADLSRNNIVERTKASHKFLGLHAIEGSLYKVFCYLGVTCVREVLLSSITISPVENADLDATVDINIPKTSVATSEFAHIIVEKNVAIPKILYDHHPCYL